MSDDKPEAEKAEADQPAAETAAAAAPAAAEAAVSTEPSTSSEAVSDTAEAQASEADSKAPEKADSKAPEKADSKAPEKATTEPAPAPKSSAPKAGNGHATPAHDHGHGHGHGADHDHGLAHTTPVSLLFGILGALLVLTIATVAVTSIDLGAQGNLIVAMIIATVKAALVCTFFMHLLWDKKFNLVLFLTSVLFLILFLSMTTTDRGETQHLIDEYRALQLGNK
jgi:cytochrome c oxidase subunit 4